MIDAPWYRNPIETTAFNLYAMDEEGLFLTHEEKIQKVIDYLISSPDPNNKFIQEQAFTSAKLDINSLTFDEVDEIETEVSRRWNPRT